jgi:hypothetical protein
MKTKLLTLTAIFALTLACLTASSSKSTAQSVRESANGQGSLVAQNFGERRTFSFSAQRRPDGTVNGNAVLHNAAFAGSNGNSKYDLQIDIQCMKVVGNIAIFGGTTRRTNDPTLVDAVYFSVQDNGEPGKNRDKISRVFFFDDDPLTQGDPQLCQLVEPTDFPLEPIENGNVQVRSAIP